MKWHIPSLLAALFYLSGLASTQASAQSSAAIIKSNDSVVLSSEKAGKITRRYVEEGAAFRKGEPLLEFDCEIDKALLSQARSQYRYAEKNLASSRELRKLNSLSLLELTQSESEFAAANAEVRVKKREVDACVIKAPYDGHVTEWFVETYQTVPLSENLVGLVNNNNLRIEFILKSSQLSSVSEGTEISVFISERGKEYAAIVKRVVPMVDSVSQTVKVIAHFKEVGDAELWAGMSGQVNIPDTSVMASQ